MKLTLCAMAVVGLCAGCTTVSIPSPDELGRAANSRFAGQPIASVFARYGMPESQFTSDTGIRVLVWDGAATVRHYEPVQTVTTGTVGDADSYPFLPAVPYRQVSTTQQGFDRGYTCQMLVGVLTNGTVDRVAFDGQMYACQKFMP